MLEVKKEIREKLKEVVGEKTGFQIDQSSNPTFGDYSTNIALVCSKTLKRSAMIVAKEFVDKIKSLSSVSKYFDKVEVVKPGFINFWLSKDILINNLISIDTLKDRYGSSDVFYSKKIMVEFTDPNPFKELHIGHLYSNIIGESISRMLTVQGAILKRACYQGDVGLHVAKTLFGLRSTEYSPQQLEGKSLHERIKILGQGYVVGSKAYEVDPKAKEEINKLNKKIYDQDSSVQEIYQKGREWSLEYFEEIYKRLGTKFDYYYFESEVGKEGERIVRDNLKKGIFEQSDGAIIFPGERYGLHNRVFINSQGFPTYEAKELGLAPYKYRDFTYDESIIVTGNEINEYFKVLLKALSLIYPELALMTQHIGHGMVRLKSGKMSSRAGDVITSEWLLDETKRQIKQAFKEMDSHTLEMVTVGSVKYALLKSSILGRDIEFDFHESINLQGNSGPYLQYTYVRTQSILKKTEARNDKFELGLNDQLQEKEEIDILRHLVKFQDVVEESATHFSPHLLCNYLFELGQKFNLFYQKHKVIGSSSERLRLAITAGVGQVIKNGLQLLGIEVPEKM